MKMTYSELLKEVCRVATLYKFYGSQEAEHITVYMP